MKVLNLTGTATDLEAQDVPFVPNNTVLVYSIAGATLEESDVVGSGYTDLVVAAAETFVSVTLNKQFVKVKSGGTEAQLIGN
jgi:hypothetical protein